ncbi:MAG: serine/threonine protein kinase [Akkermansia sp.]
MEPDTRIGNYRLLDVVGQGGFGLTYLAEDTVLQCRVVLKEAIPDCPCYRDTQTGQLRPLHREDREAFETASSALLQEARRMAALQHPGLIPVREVFSSNGSVFLVMPYLPGGSLAQRIDGELQPEQVRRWLVGLLETLNYLHGKGLLHRDIKPENILFNESGHPVLIDLGSLRPCGSCVTMDGGFTLDYAAPELLARLAPPGAPADLYSLAATFRELVCGIAPPGALARAIEDTMRPLTANPERTAQWGLGFLQAIDRNLALNPAQRMQSADEWLEYLQTAAAQTAPPQSLPQQPTPPQPAGDARLKSRVSLAALLIAGCALLLAALWWSVAIPSVASAPASSVRDRSYDELRAAALQYYKPDELEAEAKSLCEPMERYAAEALQELAACSDINDDYEYKRRYDDICKRLDGHADQLIEVNRNRLSELYRRIENDEHFAGVNPRSDAERNLLQSLRDVIRNDLFQLLSELYITNCRSHAHDELLKMYMKHVNEIVNSYRSL